ncbi:hypothetical protein LINPERHAP1_LOCUS31150 [Linum perenne]
MEVKLVFLVMLSMSSFLIEAKPSHQSPPSPPGEGGAGAPAPSSKPKPGGRSGSMSSGTASFSDPPYTRT